MNEIKWTKQIRQGEPVNLQNWQAKLFFQYLLDYEKIPVKIEANVVKGFVTFSKP